MSSVFTFRCFCSPMPVDVFYMNSLFLSVFSSVSSPYMWVIAPAKPPCWVETFGTLAERRIHVGPAATPRHTCLLLFRAFLFNELVFCFFCFFCCSRSLNLDFPNIGLSLLNFILKLCFLAFSLMCEVMARCSENPPPCNPGSCPPPLISII